jgi:hypothetical protein
LPVHGAVQRRIWCRRQGREQAKNALQKLDALAHRVGMRKGPEVAVAPVLGPAVKAQARIAVAGDHEVRIGLVVAKKDVVARREALDVVVFKQQRLAFGARHRDLDRRHLRQHHLDARACRVLGEVGGNALLEIPRLADIEGLAAACQHAVDARKIRQPGDKSFRLEHG